MRSSTVLAALVAGTIDVVSAGRCNLSKTLGGPVSSGATEEAAGTSATGIATTGAATLGTVTKGTVTSSIPATTTSRPIIATNAIRGGSFEGYSPAYRNGIYGFNSQNEARLISGHGYKKDGSKDDNCVEMQARSTVSKRDIAEFASIEQELENLDITSLYTVRFYYYLLENDIVNTCKIDVLYGNDLFTSTPYFPLAQPTDPTREWEEVVAQAAIKTSSGLLQFQLNCVNGGRATIWVDQVFVSNQVTPDNIDSISLMFTWDAGAPTENGPITPSSTNDATTTTDSTSKQSTSSSIITSTEVSTTSSTATSTTSSSVISSTTTTTVSTTSSGATPTGNKVCASLGATGDPGRGCAIRPYNPSSGYRTISSTRMTMQQCAAICLIDSRCQQFQWGAYSSSQPCINNCILIETNLGTAQGIAGPYYAYDRSCIARTECPAQPDGAICVNALGDTPAAGCKTQVIGTVKSCASAFLTTNVGMVCDSSRECRDLCAKHNACKSYSINFAGGCSLYSGSVSQIVQPGSSGQAFYDLSCNECGSSPMGYFNYVPQMDDSDTTMVNNCPLVTATSTTSQSSTSTTQQATTTTSATPTTTGVCPSGTSAPGICQTASSPAAGSTCGKLGGIYGVNGFWVTQAIWTQTKVEDCALYCAAHPQQCGAYGWDSMDSGTPCRFSPKALSQSNFLEDSTSYVTWYDMGCVSCTVCKDPPSTSTTSTSSAPLPTGTCALTNGQGCSLKLLADSSIRCKQAGDAMEDAWGYDRTRYPFQDSPEQCAAICAQETSCKSSVFDSSRASCGFITSTLAQAQFQANTGTMIWSDQACWDCPTCSTAVSTSSSSSSSSSSLTTFETSTKTTSSTNSLTTETATTLTSNSLTATSTSSTQTSTTSQAPTASCVATASLGDDVTCGLPGMAGNQAQSRTLSNFVIKPVANLGACAQVCLDRTDCLGFSYTSDTKVCIPYTVGTSDLGLSYVSTSKTRYYDRGCYGCA